MPTPRPEDGIHKVRAGQWVSSIAREYGIEDWKSVWNDDGNSALKEKRDPFVLAPGDSLFIPEVGEKKDDAQTTKLHTYKIADDTDIFRIRLMKDLVTPLKKTSVFYTVETSEGYRTWLRDTVDTDGDGYLKIECPRSAVEITLEYTVTDEIAESEIPCRVRLFVGFLRPMRADDAEKVRVLGVQARLRGLGFTPGKLDGIIGPRTLAAIKGFQSATADKEYRKTYGLDAELKVNGQITSDLTDALIKAYGA